MLTQSVGEKDRIYRLLEPLSASRRLILPAYYAYAMSELTDDAACLPGADGSSIGPQYWASRLGRYAFGRYSSLPMRSLSSR